MRLPSRAVHLVAAAALPLALAACSSGSSGPSGSSASATKTKDPNAGLMTGTQLKKLLAPASFFAAGFAVDPSAARDTGDTYIPPATGASKPDCDKLGGTSWIAITGITGVSFAQNDYVSKNTSEDIAQEIDVYRGSTAASVLKSLEKITTTTCSTYTDSQTHTPVKASGKPTAGLGDGAYTITLTDSAWENGTTLIAARVGTAVVSVMSTDGKDNGAATAKKLTAQIVGSLQKKA